MLELILIAIGTALATGLGAVPVFLLGSRAERLRPTLLGIAAGVMGVAAVAGLLEPALDDGSVLTVFAGCPLPARRPAVPGPSGHRGDHPRAARLAARVRGPLRPQSPRGFGARDRLRVHG
jgi:hypothetical protein